jgi:hypothetical protein
VNPTATPSSVRFKTTSPISVMIFKWSAVVLIIEVFMNVNLNDWVDYAKLATYDNENF